MPTPDRTVIQVLMLILISLFSVTSQAESARNFDIDVMLISEDSTSLPRILYQVPDLQTGLAEMHGRADMNAGLWDLYVHAEDGARAARYEFRERQGDETETGKVIDVSGLQPAFIELMNLETGETLVLRITPGLEETPGDALTLTEVAYGLNFLCLRDSLMVVNETFVVAELNGFGERMSADIPSLANLAFSLREIRDWQPIGVFKDGKIEIPLDHGDVVSVYNVGIGPEGFTRGGPFKVFGNIAEPTGERTEAIESTEKFLPDRYPEQRATAIIKSIKQSPYARLTAQTIGSDQMWSDALVKRIGLFDSDRGCGGD